MTKQEMIADIQTSLKWAAENSLEALEWMQVVIADYGFFHNEPFQRPVLDLEGIVEEIEIFRVIHSRRIVGQGKLIRYG